MKGQIHKHPKANSNGFRENPQNINRSGANRSLLYSIVRRLFETNNSSIDIQGANLLDSTGCPTGEKVNVSVNLPTSESISAHYIKRVFKSDRVLIDLLNRVDGRPTLALESIEMLGSDNEGKSKINFKDLTPLESDIFSKLSAKILMIDENGEQYNKEPLDFQAIIRKHSGKNIEKSS